MDEEGNIDRLTSDNDLRRIIFYRMGKLFLR